nr:SDR family NAD(P)-dependent oxidoreductase [Paenibacillus sp. OSY-SE]
MDKPNSTLIHPLLHENVSDFSEQIFRSVFTGHEFFLDDHRVNDRKILPGAAVLEMARAAGELAGGKTVYSIKDIVWLYPIEVKDDRQTVNIRLYPDGNRAVFEVSIPDESGRNSGEEILCAEGKLEYEDSTDARDSQDSLDIATLKAHCRTGIEGQRIYEAMKADGLMYGPCFQTIAEVNYNENEVLAHFKLMVSDIREKREGEKNFILHPALLDGALQSISSLLQKSEGQKDRLYLPFSMDRIRIGSPLPEAGYVYATRSKKQLNTGDSDDLIKCFDITVVDGTGKICVEIEGFHVKAVQNKSNQTDGIDPIVIAPESTLYFENVWEEVGGNTKEGRPETESTGPVLLFDTNAELRNTLQTLAGNQTEKANTIILVKPGTEYKPLGNHIYDINPSHPEDYRTLLADLKHQDLIPNRIIHYWSSDESVREPNRIDTRLERGIYSVLALSQTLMELRPQNKVRLLYAFPGEEKVTIPEYGAMSGFSKIIQMENPAFIYKTLELITSRMSLSEIAALLWREFLEKDREIQIRHDGQRRWAKKIRETGREQEPLSNSLIRDNGVYLITGGLGGLGLIFARYLCEKVKARIVLAGRREQDERVLNLLKEIEASGSEVLYVQADVSSRQDVEELVSKARARFNKIDGVIHSAGVIKDAFILNKSKEDMAAVLAAKVYGTMYLDEMLKDEPLDFFVLFSSVASALGNIGQCDYGYANSYMDHFAASREEHRAEGKRSGKTISINWPLWADGGMTIERESIKWMEENAGMISLSREEGIQALEDALRSPVHQLIVIKGKGNMIRQALHIASPHSGGTDGQISARNRESTHPGVGIEAAESGRERLREETERYLKEVLSQKTQINVDKIDVLESFEKYGIDSILIMSLTRSLEESMGELSKTLFFEYRNIRELASYFIENKTETLVKLFGKVPVNNAEEARVGPSRKKWDKKTTVVGDRFRFSSSDGQTQGETGRYADDIAIIGVSGRYPMADNLEQFWENLKNGKDCITEIPPERWDYRRYYDPDKEKIGKTYSKWGGFVNDVEMFDPLFFNIPPIDAEFIDPQARLFMQVSWQALEDAGYTRSALEKDKVGVFVGVMNGMYELFDGEIKGTRVPVGSSYSSIANRVSYFFNFQGPSIALDTMCSSSLTALHLGCESIRNGESDLVIAGGVNLTLHPNKYILLSMGKFTSSDGRCRSFGEGGDGYVPGEGVGAVLLKPLRKAMADKDHIYAVIKGSSINSGGKTSGFTVPNPNAQGDLIKAALDRTDIDPRTISYIETHGTGTSLGDPIEITGLTKAFREQTIDNQYCAIGSIKSNIGHLESAAGIAGLTKVLLQMQHRQLVPSIHSEPINPYISFKTTPFYVQQTLQHWEEPVVRKNGKESRYPRRAGISSFGAGGANAHIIVEEYQSMVPESSGENNVPELYVLSARNEERLKEYTALLLDYLKKRTGSLPAGQSALILPSDISRPTTGTLSLTKIRDEIISIASQIIGVNESDIDPNRNVEEYGFDQVQFQLFLNQVIQNLELDIPPAMFNSLRSIDSLVEYVGSLAEAEASEPQTVDLLPSLDTASVAYTLQVGREAMEERLAIVAKSMDELTEKLALYLEGKERIEQLYRGNILNDKLKTGPIVEGDTGNTFISSLMHARELNKIAELWVAGVALDWRLLYSEQTPYRIPLPTYPFAKERCWVLDIENRDEGKTLSVESIHPLLHRNTSNIYELRFSSSFSGSEFFLEDHLVEGKKILPGVVYLEMARAAVQCAMGLKAEDGISIRLTNVVWIMPVEVGNQPVTLHISLLPDESGEIAFTIYRDGADEEAEPLVHCQGNAQLDQVADISPMDIESLKSQCRVSSLDGKGYYNLFRTLGIDYGPSHQGIDNVYQGENQVLAGLSLPSSLENSFSEYILHPSLLDSALQATIGLSLPLVSSYETELTGTKDKRKAALPFALNELEIFRACSPKVWAMIRPDADSKPGDRIQKLNIDIYDTHGHLCVRLKQISFRSPENEADLLDASGTAPTEQLMFSPQWEEKTVSVDVENPEYSRRLVILCEPKDKLLEGVKAQLTDTPCIALESDASSVADRFQDYTAQLLKETQNILASRRKERVLIQLYIHTDTETQVFAGLSGFLKTAQMEEPHLLCQLIESEQGNSADEISTILNENSKSPLDHHVRYTDRGRLVWELKECTVASDERRKLPWKDGGVYLVTGGAGGLGLLVADEITRQTKNPVLILAGRSALKENATAHLRELEAGGATVRYKEADVTDERSVNELVQGVIIEFGSIQGVIHCSGVIHDSVILKKSERELREVLAPKVMGLVNLDQATRELPLDFLILFSSMASVTGNIGQSDYAAANAFMDHFAARRNDLVAKSKRSGHTLSINWPLWSDGGMRIAVEIEKLIREGTGLVPMRTTTGMELLYASVASDQTQVIALEGHAEKIRSYLFNRLPDSADTGKQSLITELTSYTPYDEESIQEQFVNVLKRMLSSELKLQAERIDARVPLETYGINSVLIMQLTSQLEKSFGSLPKTLFFEYQSLMELSRYFCESYPERVRRILGIDTNPVSPQPMEHNTTVAAKQAGPGLKVKTPLWKNKKSSLFISSETDERVSSGLDLAIIGVAGQYPKAASLEEYWNNLKEGRDCVTEIPKERWDHSVYYDEDKNKPNKTYAKWGGFIDGVDCFDPLFFNISPREAEIMDPQERLFLQCVYHTIEDAGYTRNTLGRNMEFGFTSNVGVFVGVMYEEYQLYGAQAQLQGNMYTLTGSPASIANRVSYLCGFHGPSMAVDTMCSSSLVAIHLACQSIMNGECEVAVAGGVNLSIHPNKFLMLGQSGFMSSKGRCETFGAGGDGYTPGEGVGAILLKPKAKAIADGDHIYGIIRGSAINHGGKTNGYTVPNPSAQTSVIKRALKQSGINPRAISYIEAHGTGTSLGDPIEIAGLKRAFEDQTLDQQFCQIGSVKSNIGHCESAAGLAGVTKVLLQMKYGQIAPSLHSTELNPHIDFDNSPFMVPQELTEWKRPLISHNGENREYPRIAGLSSFGAGGANAHLIIEEYIPQESSQPVVASSQPVIIVLSAKTEEQLKEQAKQLLLWVRKEQQAVVDLRNLAYTLQVGREAMEERLAFTVTSTAELEEKLNDYLEGRNGTGSIFRDQANSFNNVLSVFDSDKELQDALDKWIKQAKYAKLLELWVKGLSLDWSKLYGENKPKRVSLPTYPFERDRYWVSFSPTPMLLSKSDGTKQVDKIHPLVHQNISSFYEQRFCSSFTGQEFFLADHCLGERKILPGAATLEMARAAGQLSAEKKIPVIKDILWLNQIEAKNDNCKVYIHLYPSGNTADFEVSIVDETVQMSALAESERIICTQGRLEYEDLPLAEADPVSLDTTAIRERCQFLIKGAECYDSMNASGLINGPQFQVIQELYYNKSEALSFLTLPSGQKDDLSDYALHPGLLNGAFQTVIGLMKQDEHSAPALFIPFALSEIRIFAPLTQECIVHVTWSSNPNAVQSSIHKFNITITDGSGKILAILDDFTLKSFMVNEVNEGSDSALTDRMNQTSLAHSISIKESGIEIGTPYFTTEWNKSLNNRISERHVGGTVLVFDTNKELSHLIEKRLKNESDASSVILVNPGNAYRELGNGVFELNPSLQEDYKKLLQELSRQGLRPERIIFYKNSMRMAEMEKELDIQLEQGIYSLFYLSRALMEQKPDFKIQLLFAFVTNKDEVIPEYSAMSGFSRVIRMENPAFLYKTIEIQRAGTSVEGLAERSDADLLLEEFNKMDAAIEIRYEGSTRLVKGMKEIEARLESESSSLIKDGGVYVITGGLGELGMVFARYLAQKAKARLVLTGRSDLNEENRAKLKELEAAGAEILYVKADVSKRKDVEEIVAEAKIRFKRIDGVIHSAGVLRDAFVLKKRAEEIGEVLSAKVYGTKYLDEVLRDEPLDFMVLFSSAAAVLGNIGQSDYGYANSYMDHFAQWRETQRADGKRLGKTLSINWPLWEEGGMTVDEESLRLMKDGMGMLSLSSADGIPVFEQGLQLSATHLLALKGDVSRIRKALTAPSNQEIATNGNKSTAQNEAVTSLPKANQEVLLSQIESYLKDLVSRTTKISKGKIRVDESFGKYGIDSILIIGMNRSMEEDLGELSKTLFFEYGNIKELARYLLENKKESLLKLFGKISESRPAKSEDKDMARIRKKEQVRTSRLSLLQPARTAPREGRLPEEEIAIIGVSGRYPMARTLDEFWGNLKTGKNCVTEIPDKRWDHKRYYDPEKGIPGKTYSKWGGFIEDVEMFDSLFFNIPPADAEFIDPQERLFLETTWHALEDAGYPRNALEKEKVGVFVGVMYGLYQLLETEANGNRIFARSSYASIANRVSYFFNFNGPSIALDTMCSSSLTAIHLGCDSIRKGESNVVIAGGVNLALHPSKYLHLSLGNFVSSDGRCRSFGEGGDGYVPGEGVGAVVLKSLTRAIADGDHIYAVIKGSAINSGGKTSGYTVPNPNAQGDLIKEVLQKTKIDANTISYVESHGTGTALGDPIEIAGISKAFGEYMNERQYCSIGSVKSNIGHLESAAGIAAITKVLLQMKHKQLVPSLHSEQLNPYITFKDTPFYVQQTLQEWEQPVVSKNNREHRYPRRAGISSFGAGGANAHIILEEYEEPVSPLLDRDDNPQLIVLSARNEERLKAYVEQMRSFLNRSVTPNPTGLLSEANRIEAIRQQVIQEVAEMLSIDQTVVNADEHFTDYGFDQYSLTAFSEWLQQKWGSDIPRDVTFEHSTVNQLAHYLASHYADEALEGPVVEHEPEAADTVSLADLAYTLQVGRENMEERLAIIASNLDDLQSGLADYCNGKLDNPNLKLGNTTEFREKLDILLNGEVAKEHLKKLMQEGDLVGISELWVMGADVTWEILHDNRKTRRLSLPNYPFARERHWIIPDRGDGRLVPDDRYPEAAVVSPPERGETPAVGQAQVFLADGDQIDDRVLSEAVLDYLKQAFSTILKIPVSQLSATVEFDAYGIDSIYINQINKYFETIFGKLPSTLLFTYKNLKALSRYFVEQQREKSILALKLPEKHWLMDPPVRTGNVSPVSAAIAAPSPEQRDILDAEQADSEQGIAIIGVSGMFPQAGNMEEFMQNLMAAKDCITEIPKERWDHRQYPNIACKWGGFVEDADKFDPQFFNIAPINAAFMDPQERLFLQAAWSCLEDAGYTPHALEDPDAGDNRGNVAVYAGVTFNGYGLFGATEMAKGNAMPLNSQIFSVANRVSYLLNLRGPSLSVDTACSSSLYAIHLGCESLLKNECDMAIAGGVNLSLHPSKYLTLDWAKFLASDGHCRSFGEGGDGYVPGEGAGAVLLKPLWKAKRDRDHIYGVIKASAVNHGGRTHGYTVPNPVAQAEVVKKALEKANIDPRTISYIEAHGTGTSLGDPIEISALTDAFGAHSSDKQYCSIGSVKSNIGHLEAAAGIAQVAKVLLQFKHKVLVPTLLNAERTNPNIDFANTPFRVQLTAEEWKKPILDQDKQIEIPRRAGVSSFGVGGVNVHLIIEEYEAEAECPQPKSDALVLVPLSAKSDKVLKDYAIKLKNYLTSNLPEMSGAPTGEGDNDIALPDLRDIAFTLQTGRITLPYRVAFVASGYEQLIQLLEQYLRADGNQKLEKMKGLYTGKVALAANRAQPENPAAENEHLTPEDRVVSLAEQWVQRSDIHLADHLTELYADYLPYRASLPVYPFEKERHWFYGTPGEPSPPDEVSTLVEVTKAAEEVAVSRIDEPQTISPASSDSTSDTGMDSSSQADNDEADGTDTEFLYQLFDSPDSEHQGLMVTYVQKMVASLLVFTEGRLPDIEQGFFELGLESIISAQFKTLLEERFRLELDNQVLFNYPNIIELSGHILSLIEWDELESFLETDQTASLPGSENVERQDNNDLSADELSCLSQDVLPEEIENMGEAELIARLLQEINEEV